MKNSKDILNNAIEEVSEKEIQEQEVVDTYEVENDTLLESPAMTDKPFFTDID